MSKLIQGLCVSSGQDSKQNKDGYEQIAQVQISQALGAEETNEVLFRTSLQWELKKKKKSDVVIEN